MLFCQCSLPLFRSHSSALLPSGEGAKGRQNLAAPWGLFDSAATLTYTAAGQSILLAWHADTWRDSVHIPGVGSEVTGVKLALGMPPWLCTIHLRPRGSVYACCLYPSLSCAPCGGARQSRPALPGQSG